MKLSTDGTGRGKPFAPALVSGDKNLNDCKQSYHAYICCGFV